MQAEKIILQTDANGKLTTLPVLPPLVSVEAIFIILGKKEESCVRVPPPQLAAITTICGNIMDAATDEADWEALS